MTARGAFETAGLLLALLLTACEPTTPAPSAGASAALEPSIAASAQAPAAENQAASPSTAVEPSAQASAAASTPASAAGAEASPDRSAQASIQASGAAGSRASPSAGASARSSAQASVAASPAASVDLAAAADYCAEQGGTVVTRYPLFGANLAPAQQLRLDGSVLFCQFQRAFDEAPGGFRSRISIALATLYTEQPTLAMLAYLTPRPLPRIPAAVNPSSVYCSWLGGTSLFGGAGNGAGGGWVKTGDASTAFEQVSMCVFPDLSSISDWGLTYNAGGAIRGVDLATVARYQPAQPPIVFPDGRPRRQAAESGSQASAAPASNTVAVDETSDGGAVTLSVGQELVIALAANPTTGFSWQVDRIDEAVLRQAGDAEFRPATSAPGLAGAPSIETLRFQAAGAGETTLTLVYRRPFEAAETPTPENSFTLRVTVR